MPNLSHFLKHQIKISRKNPIAYAPSHKNKNGLSWKSAFTNRYGYRSILRGVTGGRTWNDISQPVTAFDGSYYALWMPSATGEYIVKAVWAGNVTIQGAMAYVDFAVVPFDAKNVFSVASNSTISSLSFDSDTRELNFVVSGPDGTEGYIKIIIAKSLIADMQAVKVKLNNTEIDYTASSIDDSWQIYFTYAHSSHIITVNLLGLSCNLLWNYSK